jgi:predicted O-methyltransferase YrrM
MLLSDGPLLILIITNLLSLFVIYIVSNRMLKLRRQKKRSFNFSAYPIPQVKLDSVAPCFVNGPYGPVPDSVVSFIGGEGVVASVSDRETWVLAGLAKSAKIIFEFGTCSGKTTHVMALNSTTDAKIYTLTIHPDQLDGLTFENGDDERHQKIAGLEARFESFYYQGRSTEGKIIQVFSDSKQYDEGELIGKVDLIFIDGAHTKSYVMSDSSKAFRMLSSTGVIIWHDYKVDAPDVFNYLNDLSKSVKIVHIKDTDMAMYRRNAN